MTGIVLQGLENGMVNLPQELGSRSDNSLVSAVVGLFPGNGLPGG